MKRIINKLQKSVSRLFLLSALSLTVASCDSVLNFDEGDCSVEYRVRFKYDYNMKYANAFANEVKTVTLYAFDDDGKFIYQRTEEGEMLKADDYSMRVDIEPGEYHLVAWAGLDDKSFAVPLLTPGLSDIDELTVKANRIITQTRADGTKESIIRSQLSSLWHGESKQAFTRAGKQNIITVPLVKNTNTIRIILQQMEGKAINPDDFYFAIYDDNGWMNYDNTLLKDDQLTYEPYLRKQGSVSNSTTRAGNDNESSISVAIAELSVARLIEEKNPILRITNKESGAVVLQIPLVEYVLLAKTESSNSMDAQEYLDRQDEYVMNFFLDGNLSWISTKIIINGWTIRNNPSEL